MICRRTMVIAARHPPRSGIDAVEKRGIDAYGPINRGVRRQRDGRCADDADPLACSGARRRRLFFRCARLDDPRGAGSRHDQQRLHHRAAGRGGGEFDPRGPADRLRRTGRVHRPLRPQGRLSIQFAALWRGDDRGGLFAEFHLACGTSFRRRGRARRRAAAVFFVYCRIRAQEHSRPHPRLDAADRRCLPVAGRHPARARIPGHDRLARDLDRDRHRCADHLCAALLASRNRRAGWPHTARGSAPSTC